MISDFDELYKSKYPSMSMLSELMNLPAWDNAKGSPARESSSFVSALVDVVPS